MSGLWQEPRCSTLSQRWEMGAWIPQVVRQEVGVKGQASGSKHV